MPNLRVESLATDDLRYQAFARSLAVMLWPKDDAARQQFETQLIAKRLDQLTQVLRQLEAAGEARAISEALRDRRAFEQTYFDPLGGLATLLGAAGLPQAAEHMKQKRLALETATEIAWTALRLVQMDNAEAASHFSLNKLAFFVEKNDAVDANRSRSFILEAWSEFKGVAHLWVANSIWVMAYPNCGEPAGKLVRNTIFYGIHMILPVAAWVESRIAGVVVPRATESLIPAGELWSVRLGVAANTVDPRVSAPELSPDELAVFRAYRAPRRG